MKLLDLFKESLNDIEHMRMNESPPATQVTTVKNDWLKLWHAIRDLFEVCSFIL